MKRRNKLAHFGVFVMVAAGILCFPEVAMPQAPSVDPELHIVEPIITEETMPNEPGDWDLRVSGSYLWQGTGGSGFLPRTQLFFGIANRWGAEIEVPRGIREPRHKSLRNRRHLDNGKISGAETRGADARLCSGYGDDVPER